jgi:dihydrofolate synthase / folylpolyglutamate synthase
VTYPEAIQFLYDLRLSGAKFGLENSLKLAALAGNSEAKLRFIHVAGTNGKGSTCAMIESIYRAAGLRTGLYTSPHRVSFTERIQVKGRPVSESDATRLLEEIKPALKEFPPESPPTFFEVVTNMALRYFAEQECEIVIWETGMGGRLDATNIVTPLVSVITNIQYDHQRWLGNTLPQIAFEKAGIIKPGIPVVTAEQKPEALRVLSETAQRQNAPLIRVARDDTKRPPLDALKIPLLGDHQLLNAALALAAVQAISGIIPISDEAVRSGLMHVQWPGRTQVIRTGIGRTLVLDGAHNPAGAEALRNVLQKHFPGTLPTLVLGMLLDKDWSAMCQILAPLAGRIGVAPVRSERSVEPGMLREFCQQLSPYAEVAVWSSMEEALKQTASDPLVVITGSLHFIGEAIEALKLSPAPPRNERGLNDWGAKP